MRGSMNTKFLRIFEQFLPFIAIGIAIALVLGLFLFLIHVFIWGLVIGMIIWFATLIKTIFFSRQPTSPVKKTRKKSSRIIEHERNS
jgi:hypothetical protein